MTTHAEEHHAHPSYVKIWAILLVLLIVSFVGPYAGIRVVTLLTAFGIAVVKAYIVAKYFMHINIEKKYVLYMVGSMIVLMVLMVGAVGPDVQHHKGANWENIAAQEEVERGMKAGPLHGHDSAEGHPTGAAPAHDAHPAGAPAPAAH